MRSPQRARPSRYLGPFVLPGPRPGLSSRPLPGAVALAVAVGAEEVALVADGVGEGLSALPPSAAVADALGEASGA